MPALPCGIIFLFEEWIPPATAQWPECWLLPICIQTSLLVCAIAEVVGWLAAATDKPGITLVSVIETPWIEVPGRKSRQRRRPESSESWQLTGRSTAHQHLEQLGAAATAAATALVAASTTRCHAKEPLKQG